MKVTEYRDSKIGVINEEVFNMLMGIIETMLEVSLNTVLGIGINVGKIIK